MRLKSRQRRGDTEQKQQRYEEHPPKSKGAKCGFSLRSLVLGGLLFCSFKVSRRGPFLLDGTTAGAAVICASEQRQLPEHSGKCLDLQQGKGDSRKRKYPDASTEPEKCQFYTKPSLYIDVLMKTMLGFPNHGTCAGPNCEKHAAFNPTKRKYGLDWPPFGYTMVGTQRLENFRAAIEEVNRNNIEGAIMEFGVWRGGAMIMASGLMKEYRLNGGTMERHMYVLDAFEEIPASQYGVHSEFLFNTQQEVMDNFQLFDVLDDNVHFVKGLFKDTVPKIYEDASIPQIAVLRIDGNFYDSYQDALYYMYEKVPVGGIVIFDDVMSHKPVRQCWKDFKADQGLPERLNQIDMHSAWFRKSKEIKIDMSKMRPPQDVNKA